MDTVKNFTLPMPSRSSNHIDLIECNSSVVIVGANGAGKTRLSTWMELEANIASKAHRISAQKSLILSDTITINSLDFSQRSLMYGYGYTDTTDFVSNLKKQHRWRGNSAPPQLDDYNILLQYLFSDDYVTSNAYKNKIRNNINSGQEVNCVEPPKSKLDITKDIWESILTHRKLIIDDISVKAKRNDLSEEIYNGSNLSDGERIIFYLIGQCLAAPQDGVIIIDEPELHLHKAIQSQLWNAIEAERPDCLFVYLTHDLDFAVSRKSATKIWIKSFDGKRWDWSIVPDADDIPEEILLAILGSRRPVLLVEGSRASLDYYFFSHLYPEYTIIPCGSC